MKWCRLKKTRKGLCPTLALGMLFANLHKNTKTIAHPTEQPRNKALFIDHSAVHVRSLPLFLQFNLVGRLLGPKGLTLKRIQAETQTKMTILGRGSMRDKKREEELRESGDPAHSHLNDDLHVLIEVNGPFSEYKLMAGVAEVRKMLIPNVSFRFFSLIEGFDIAVFFCDYLSLKGCDWDK